jgi:4-hydroxy-4-methyl-2-oxoglutarate aldolase
MQVASEGMADVSARFLKLYTGAIADILDKNGLRDQVLPYYITPFTTAKRLAGTAFTSQGYPCAETTHNDMEARLKMLESVTPGSISVWATGGSIECAHWGEIMSTAVKQRGCVGAVVDGGVRDVDFIDAMSYPVFAKFKCSASSIGRWDLIEWQLAIKIGNTIIHPGDFVFGDTDGVVVVPKDITMDVLAAAEDVFERERGMREELRRGVTVTETYAKYGAM